MAILRCRAYNCGMNKIDTNKLSLPQRVYLVGIGGVSMSGIAEHLHLLGHHVCGSDRTPNDYTKRLQSLGVDVQRESESVAGFDLVVKTSAVKDDHKQIVEAKSLGIPVVLREQVLGGIFDGYPTRIAICGTHGKTTATAMLHHILQSCGVSHTAFIGGSYLGRNYFGGDGIVVAEACEYNASFLHLHPTHTLCLNIEYDHPDCYQSVADVESAFQNLFEQSQRVVLPQNLQKLAPRGVFWDDFAAKNIFATAHRTTFDLLHKQEFVAKVRLPLVGTHNVKNALAVVSLCHELKLPLLAVCHALGSFCGVERRWTEVDYNCKLVYDYAHHPTEIATAVKTAQSITKGKVVCIFQPHTFTRTKAFWEHFARCFGGVTVVYSPIYPARERPIEGVTSQNLTAFAKQIGIDAHYCDTFDQAKHFVESITTKSDTILILGAGDVVNMAKLFAK